MKRLLTVLAVLTLTACSTQTTPPAPRPTPTPTVAPLTVAQATKAALRVSDLPKGWQGGVAPDPTPTLRSSVTYDPEICWQVRDPTRDSGAPVTAVRGQYFIRVGDNPVSVTEFIYSWPTPQVRIVQRISEMLPRCSTVSGTWADRETFRSTIRQLTVQGLKDGIVLRGTFVDNPKSVGYVARVVRGGTLLTVDGSNDTFTTDAAFLRFVKTAVARLDAAVG